MSRSAGVAKTDSPCNIPGLHLHAEHLLLSTYSQSNHLCSTGPLPTGLSQLHRLNHDRHMSDDDELTCASVLSFRMVPRVKNPKLQHTMHTCCHRRRVESCVAISRARDGIQNLSRCAWPARRQSRDARVRRRRRNRAGNCLDA